MPMWPDTPIKPITAQGYPPNHKDIKNEQKKERNKKERGREGEGRRGKRLDSIG